MIGAASEWIVEGDGVSPPPDIDIDSFEQDLAGEEGEPYCGCRLRTWVGWS
ncbi:hypothetical protein LINPERPRIM_LOCUS36347 [Linum perenne]